MSYAVNSIIEYLKANDLFCLDLMDFEELTEQLETQKGVFFGKSRA